MASAAELEGRRVPTFPGAKSEETQTFIGADGQPLEVSKSISKQALKILKKRGFKSEARALREQEAAAVKKAEASGGSLDDSGDDDDPSDDDTATDDDKSDEESKPPAKKAPAKAASRSS